MNERSGSRLGPTLAALRRADRKALVTFVTAGDPAPEATVPLLHALVEAGADVLELGIPFSDPEAEGPAIQAATERALARGMTLMGCFELVRTFRETDRKTPVVLMGYLNSLLRVGVESFASLAAEAGVDGLILVNLPPEEAGEFGPVLAASGVDLIFLVAPTTTAERRQAIVERSRGFVYYVSLTGTTGATHLEPGRVVDAVTALRASSPLPVLVGFGIRDGSSAARVAQGADGVIVGSALVSLQADDSLSVAERRAAAAALTAELRSALDAPQR